MNWFSLAMLLVANILFSMYAIIPLLVTLPHVRTHNISYNVGDNASIKKAITQASNEGMKYGRDYFGSGSYQLLGLMLVNFIILVILVARNNDRGNENAS